MKFETLIYDALSLFFTVYQFEAMYNCTFFFSLSLLPSSPFSVVASSLYYPGPCLGIKAETTVLVLLSSFIFSQQALCDPYEKVI